MNLTTNSTEVDEFTYPLVVQIFQTILFTVVCIVGLVGNTLVIYVVIRFSKMQTVTNMYIVNLAIADECFLIGIPFLITTILNRHWIFGYFACKAYMLSTGINQFTSSILLCVMSADRYIAVCHPISSPKWRTPFISKMVSLFAWTFSILLMIPIVQHSKEIDNDGKTSCVIEWANFDSTANISTNSTFEFDDQENAHMFTWYTFICGFAIPLCLIVNFYWLVILKLKRVGPKNKSKEKKRSHRKVTNLVLIVVTVYIICWLPYWVTQLAMSDDVDDTFSITLHLLASCMSYSNSAVNPILYAFLSDNFKKSFVKACTCAANKEVNATLQLENSVFPKKNKHASERLKHSRTRGTSICVNNDEDADIGPLVSRSDATTSGITTTTRTSNITDSSESVLKHTVRNGGSSGTQPTSL
ncbi:somatostatin receptor type 2-like isoform X1 [Diabrotica virgifera virgifera]|uniref:G-protein coupled receptors family 1 profile domain-containing protein n=2 Tax=Diabrotica virgifera virgifera TaxID=50390 RepID=A0ABM5L312_DIAVI|nr:somatostatin receptor type 2-like isoform X1 [Diabrotica virgifera virgifera]